MACTLWDRKLLRECHCVVIFSLSIIKECGSVQLEGPLRHLLEAIEVSGCTGAIQSQPTPEKERVGIDSHYSPSQC